MVSRERVDVGKLLAKLGIEARLDGDEYEARCPAHDDSKPSWSINRTSGQHHCFACGFGGGPASLVIEALDVATLAWSGRDAWEWMRSQGLLVGYGELGLDVELFLRRERSRGRFVLPFGVRLGVEPAHWPTPARRYLERRSITPGQVERWGAGYAVEGRLGGRLVFPVRARSGQLLSYTARSFTGSALRYMTPDEAEQPDLAALFGEEHWPEPGARERVLVVEGAIKALAAERALGAGACALAGLLGATQAGNVRVASKLSTFGEVVILTDGDLAGRAAAERLYGAIARHSRARRAEMPAEPVDEAEPEQIREAVACAS